jgi:serine/threonine-protein kinase
MHQGEFGKYRIKNVVGMGGMSIVYLAVDQTLNREAALKVLNLRHASNPIEARRFKREVEIAQRLRHPNIIDIYEYGEIDDFAYLAMEFMPGGTLAERYASPMPLKLLDAAEVLRVLADALDYAHSQGVLHRDLKLGNILLNTQGQLILSDFGLALIQDASRITASGQTFGTPLYMSPEQVSGLRTIDYHADIYSLGVIAYLLATGYFPFSGTSALMLLNQHLTEMPPLPSNLNPRLPHDIDDVLLRGLAKRPEDRFDSAGALAQAFADVTAEISATEIILLASQPTPIMESSSVYGYVPAAGRNGNGANGTNRNGDPFGDMTPKLTDTDLGLNPSLSRQFNTNRERRGLSPWVVALALAAVAVLLLIGANTISSIMQGASPTPTGVLPVVLATETGVPVIAITEEATPTLTPTLTPSSTPSETRNATPTRTRMPTRTASPTDRPTESRTPTRTNTPRPMATRTVSNYLLTATEQAEARRATATRNAQLDASGEPTSRPATQAQQVGQATSSGSNPGGSSGAATSAPQTIPTSVPATSVPPTSIPPTSVPPSAVPPTPIPPTSVPPTNAPPPTNTPVINLPVPTIPLVQTLLPGLLGKPAN